MENKNTELTVLDEFKILEVYKYDVIERAAEAIESEVMSHVVDITEKKGRDREASLAYKVSQAKSKVVKMANASVQDAKAAIKAVTSERLRLEARFDGIRDKRKAASVEWEAKDQARKDGHREAIDDLKSIVDGGIDHLSNESISTLVEECLYFDPSKLEEYQDEGERAKIEIQNILTTEQNRRIDKATAAAELARLQQKEADDKARIQKLEDDAKAAKQKLIDEEEARKADEAKVAAYKQAVIDAKKRDEEQAKRDKELAAEREAEAVKRIEQAKIDAVKAEQDKQAEAKRVADVERVAAENAELKRQADKDYRAMCFTDAAKDLHSKAGVTMEKADEIMTLVSNRQISRTVLNF